MHVLIVLTSHDQLGESGRKTGFWLEEFASPYYCLESSGVQITLASPKGGQPPQDPKSHESQFQTNATRRFDSDRAAQTQLANTHKLAGLQAESFDGVFYPGGHGPLWDLTVDPDSIKLIEQFLQQDKPVAAVCHAPAALLNVKSPNGRPLPSGKRVTGFSNSEETAVELVGIVPFLLEDRLVELGARYEKTDDWTSHVVEDGRLITGQNPASSQAVAEALLQQLEWHRSVGVQVGTRTPGTLNRGR